jgi:hypothetical protein
MDNEDREEAKTSLSPLADTDRTDYKASSITNMGIEEEGLLD